MRLGRASDQVHEGLKLRTHVDRVIVKPRQLDADDEGRDPARAECTLDVGPHGADEVQVPPASTPGGASAYSNCSRRKRSRTSAGTPRVCGRGSGLLPGRMPVGVAMHGICQNLNDGELAGRVGEARELGSLCNRHGRPAR